MFFVKRIIAFFSDFFLINKIKMFFLHKKNTNSVRIINYHSVPEVYLERFEKQIKWLSKKFDSCSFEDLKSFLNGGKTFAKKPGILITFDDGFEDNYTLASKVLDKYKMSAMFFVSAGLIGKQNYKNSNGIHSYMTSQQLIALAKAGNAVGSHTFSHHRMNKNDSDETLVHEIVDSRIVIQSLICQSIDSFCWCGGEDGTYTKKAYDLIRQNYMYSFITHSKLITPRTNPYMLTRTNIGSGWPLSLVRFQLCGFIDSRYKKKLNKLEELFK